MLNFCSSAKGSKNKQTLNKTESLHCDTEHFFAQSLHLNTITKPAAFYGNR